MGEDVLNGFMYFIQRKQFENPTEKDIEKIQFNWNMATKSAEVFNVIPEVLAETSDRFFKEHKLLKRELIKNKRANCPTCNTECKCVKIVLKPKKEWEKEEFFPIRRTVKIKLIYVMKCEKCNKTFPEVTMWESG
jgi:hypothetical protein